MSHDYKTDKGASRATRKQSKLGPGIIDAQRMDELLQEYDRDTCVRCRRPFAGQPWPLERGDRCSPRDWVYCIRPRPGATPGADSESTPNSST